MAVLRASDEAIEVSDQYMVDHTCREPLMLASTDVGRPLASADNLTLIDGESGIARIGQDPADIRWRERCGYLGALVGRGQPSPPVERPRNLARVGAAARETE